jgi:p-hydroxybenzoate 3-monooxygenase
MPRALESLLKSYSSDCLRRVWRAQEFSSYMTAMLHPLLGDPFEDRLAIARLDYVVRSQAAAKSLAENYVDLANL